MATIPMATIPMGHSRHPDGPIETPTLPDTHMVLILTRLAYTNGWNAPNHNAEKFTHTHANFAQQDSQRNSLSHAPPPLQHRHSG